jgi:hypothetical protein
MMGAASSGRRSPAGDLVHSDAALAPATIVAGGLAERADEQDGMRATLLFPWRKYNPLAIRPAVW